MTNIAFALKQLALPRLQSRDRRAVLDWLAELIAHADEDLKRQDPALYQRACEAVAQASSLCDGHRTTTTP